MKKGRKISGGKYKKARKKRLFERDNQTRVVKLGKRKVKNLRVRSGRLKPVLFSCDVANLIDKKTHKSRKVKIINVVETPSNRFLARQNVIVKSAIIDTDAGKARVTNRPSQEGKIECVLI